jgi:hypothetical protein
LPPGIDSDALRMRWAIEHAATYGDMLTALQEVRDWHAAIACERERSEVGHRTQSKLEQAGDLYQRWLRDGPRPRPEIEDEAKRAKVAPKTLRTVRERLRKAGVLCEPYKQPGSRHYFDKLAA